MIIKNVFIENFGGVFNKRFDFDDGLNVISLPNEGGKSTVAEFIRVMLYGVNSLRFNQRKRYMTFGASTIGGEITVDCQNAEYVIRRTFGSRKTDDKIDVYNSLNGAREDRLCVDNVGELLMGISGDTYDNTCYIKQLGCALNEEKSAEIQAKLINLSQSGSEDYSYKKAINILDSALRELNGTKGKINHVRAKLNELAVMRAKKQGLAEEIKRCTQQLNGLEKGDASLKPPYAMIACFAAAAVLCAMCFFIKPFVVLPFAALAAAGGVVLALRRRKASASVIELARQNGFYESRLQSLKKEYESIDVSQQEYFMSELERLNAAAADINFAKQCLTEAFEELQKDYIPRLNKTAFAIFKKMTGEKYVDFLTDDRYNITVRDAKNNIIQGVYLSSGTFDQIYFSLRMALVGLIAPDAPIILDDSFALYDDSRLKNALSYLKGVKNQTILFTCHTRENEFLRF